LPAAGGIIGDNRGGVAPGSAKLGLQRVHPASRVVAAVLLYQFGTNASLPVTLFASTTGIGETEDFSARLNHTYERSSPASNPPYQRLVEEEH
jgi:hypothetical protein